MIFDVFGRCRGRSDPLYIAERAVRLAGSKQINMWAIFLRTRRMDVTTITCASSTRDALADYRDSRDHPNYDEALQDLLNEVTTE